MYGGGDDRENSSSNGSLLVIPHLFSPFTDNEQKRPFGALCHLLVAATALCLFFTYCPLGAGQEADVLGYEAGGSRGGRRSAFPGSGPLVGAVGLEPAVPGKAGLSG